MPNCQKTIRRQCHGKHIPPFSSVKEFSVKTISRALTCSNEDRPFLKFVNSKSHLKYFIDMRHVRELRQTWRLEFVLIVVYWSVTFAKKISNFTPVLSITIVLDSFYPPIFYFEKFSTWIWSLLFVVNVIACRTDATLLANNSQHC